MAILLAVVMLCGTLPIVSAIAADVVDSGKCGDNLTWTLDSEGTLTISGQGEMWDQPWYEYRENISRVIIKNGVTSICNYAFDCCVRLTSVTIPDSLTSIGCGAFSDCIIIKDVYYAGSKEEWNNIEIESGNERLLNATIHFNFDPNHQHSYISKITKEATCTQEGTKTFTCACGESYTEVIPKTDHTDNNDDGKCDTCGKDLGTKPPEEKPKPDNSFIGKIKDFFDRIINWIKNLFKIK